VISEALWTRLANPVAGTAGEELHLRGREKPVTIYRLQGGA
jgi:class 3 adenylate cyclase